MSSWELVDARAYVYAPTQESTDVDALERHRLLESHCPPGHHGLCHARTPASSPRQACPTHYD
jgi:hypothetical protein